MLHAFIDEGPNTIITAAKYNPYSLDIKQPVHNTNHQSTYEIPHYNMHLIWRVQELVSTGRDTNDK